jgi:hypothetical protein
MQRNTLLTVLLLCAFCSFAAAKQLFSRDLPAVDVLDAMPLHERSNLMRSFFDEFKTVYKREYASEKEHTVRFGIFEVRSFDHFTLPTHNGVFETPTLSFFFLSAQLSHYLQSASATFPFFVYSSGSFASLTRLAPRFVGQYANCSKVEPNEPLRAVWCDAIRRSQLGRVHERDSLQCHWRGRIPKE